MRGLCVVLFALLAAVVLGSGSYASDPGPHIEMGNPTHDVVQFPASPPPEQFPVDQPPAPGGLSTDFDDDGDDGEEADD